MRYMDPELKRLLDETHTLTKDNNRMLRAIRRDQWFGFVGKIIIWIIVLALPLYLYQQYLQPLISKFSTIPGVTASGPFSLPTSTELQKLINFYKVGQ